MITASLTVIETPSATSGELDRALDVVQLHIENLTVDKSRLPNDALTRRIRVALTGLLDRSQFEQASRVIWMLGHIDDPTLDSDYRRWLRRYLKTLLACSASMHQLLVNLDDGNETIRDASVGEIEENVRRSQEYLCQSKPE